MSLYSLSARDGEIQSEKLLVEAAANGDVETVITLLESGVSVDADEYNKTLFYASKNYMTPLQLACANGYISCVEVLISNNADVNPKDRFDVTAMHMAAEKGNYSCLKSLLNANAECSIPTKFSKTGCYTAVPHPGGTTPLHLASFKNHVECVRELIQYGADYNAVDERGRTSLYIAAQYGHSECILAHLKNAVGRDILSLPSFETGDTPLHFAVSKGMVECVKELLISGSDVNHLNFAGRSPLHLALTPTTNEKESVSLEMLQLLVLEGYNTDIDQVDGTDLTPLHYVCFSGFNNRSFRRRPEMAKFLISYGANVNINTTRGFSLLEYELKSTTDDTELLKYIVRSMLHLPHLRKLRVLPYLPYGELIPDPPQPREIIAFEMAIAFQAVAFRGSKVESLQNALANSNMGHKYIWYEILASQPRTLQHYCRYTIRQALGPCSIKFIKTLPIPSALQSYLLLEYDD